MNQATNTSLQTRDLRDKLAANAISINAEDFTELAEEARQARADIPALEGALTEAVESIKAAGNLFTQGDMRRCDDELNRAEQLTKAAGLLHAYL
jgi:predicted Zn-dependent protease